MDKVKHIDQYIIWIISGAITTLLFADLFSIILKLMGTATHFSWNLAADFVIQGRRNIESFSGVIIGITVDYFIGIFNGFLIGIILNWFGTKYYLLKGIGVALSNFLVLIITAHSLPQVFTYKLTLLNFITYFFTYSIFGAANAHLIVFMSKHVNVDLYN